VCEDLLLIFYAPFGASQR